MGHIRAWGTFVFLRFVGIRVVVRPQCKSAEYYFHHRPSFAVESSIIVFTTFYKILKMHFARVIETLSKSSIFVIPGLEIGVHLFKIHPKETPPIHGASANLFYQIGVIFQK